MSGDERDFIDKGKKKKTIFFQFLKEEPTFFE